VNGGINWPKKPQDAHKKIRQKVDLLLLDKGFVGDVENLRTGSLRSVVREAIRLNDLSNQEFFGFVRKDKDLSVHLKTYLDLCAKRSEIEKSDRLTSAILSLIKTYKLFPEAAWLPRLTDFILYGELRRPVFISAPSLAKLNLSPDQHNKVVTALYDLGENNFGIEIREETRTGEIAFFIRVLENTAKQDIVAGWGNVSVVRDAIFGKKNFYPLKSLDLAKKIREVDAGDSSNSDWDKAEKIFGEAKGAGWGKTERKRKRKIQQTRSRYKKRFGTKS